MFCDCAGIWISRRKSTLQCTYLLNKNILSPLKIIIPELSSHIINAEKSTLFISV
jgi:hypothetical protein